MEERAKLSAIFVNLFSVKPEDIHDKLSQDDVPGWDSLQHLNLILAIEEDFGISLSPEETTEMLNFGLILLLVQEKLKSKGQ
jgi:acyl carrier protein